MFASATVTTFIYCMSAARVCINKLNNRYGNNGHCSVLRLLVSKVMLLKTNIRPALHHSPNMHVNLNILNCCMFHWFRSFCLLR